MHETEAAEEEKADGEEGNENGGFDYLSSHPSDAERIARLRAADAQ